MRGAIDARPRLAFQRFFESEISNLRAAEIADALAEHHLAVVMDILLHVIRIELTDDVSAAVLIIR